MSTLTVIVADDEAPIRDLLIHHLEREGYHVRATHDGPTTLRAARDGADLVILDIGLPVIDGFEVIRTLRREGKTLPVVALTARVDEIDRVIGLELGADDYLTKPFSTRELLARIRSILRRSGLGVPQAPTILRFGRLEIDQAGRAARVDGKDITLKPREFALLLELTKNAGVALSRTMLLERVWGFDFDGDERTVDVHVRRLRMKIEERHALPGLVQTVRNFGYKCVRPADH